MQVKDHYCMNNFWSHCTLLLTSSKPANKYALTVNKSNGYWLYRVVRQTVYSSIMPLYAMNSILHFSLLVDRLKLSIVAAYLDFSHNDAKNHQEKVVGY